MIGTTSEIHAGQDRPPRKRWLSTLDRATVAAVKSLFVLSVRKIHPAPCSCQTKTQHAALIRSAAATSRLLSIYTQPVLPLGPTPAPRTKAA
eukprot:6212169-Pleurochrysis_carterae.AAC.2